MISSTPNQSLDDRLAFTVAHLAKAADCDTSTVHRAIRSGKLAARKLGRKTLILRHDALAWLEALPIRDPDADTPAVAQARRARQARTHKPRSHGFSVEDTRNR